MTAFNGTGRNIMITCKHWLLKC